MQKLEDKLKEIKKEKRLALMTHVVVGYPSLDATIRLVKIMEKAGADMVELQIPFSDPLADGPTIMRACESSLANGTKVKDAFIVAKKLSREVSIPLLFMAYYNTVFCYKNNFYSSSERSKSRSRFWTSQNDGSRQARTITQNNMSGVEAFIKDAKEAGISGLIVPDMPIEEEGCEHFMQFCRKYALANIQVVSPASMDDRLKKNAKVARGFVYVTARQGITGAQEFLDPSLTDFLKKVKKYFSVPIAVGFGISKKEHIEVLKNHANIAIVGSAIIDVMNKSKPESMEKNVSSFIRELKIVN